MSGDPPVRVSTQGELILSIFGRPKSWPVIVAHEAFFSIIKDTWNIKITSSPLHFLGAACKSEVQHVGIQSVQTQALSWAC